MILFQIYFVDFGSNLPLRRNLASQFLRHVITPIAQHSPAFIGQAVSIWWLQWLSQAPNLKTFTWPNLILLRLVLPVSFDQSFLLTFLHWSSTSYETICYRVHHGCFEFTLSLPFWTLKILVSMTHAVIEPVEVIPSRTN